MKVLAKIDDMHGSGRNVEKVVTNMGDFKQFFGCRQYFPKYYYFKRPLVIRKATGLVRGQINGQTWRVEPHEYGILIWTRKKKKLHEVAIKVDWSDIDHVEGEWDPTYWDNNL